MAVSGKISAKIEKMGSVAVGARELFERVRMMPEGKIAISLQNVALSRFAPPGRRVASRCKGLPGSEFPTLPQPGEGASSMTLGTEVLSALIAATHFSISTDETRLHLNSALFEWKVTTCAWSPPTAIGCRRWRSSNGQARATASMLIPLKGVHELKRLCDEAKSDGTTTISVIQSGPNAFFSVPGFSSA